MNKPHIIEAEDGSIFIEFIKDDKRFGILLQTNELDSRWYYRSLSAKVNGKFSAEMIKALEKFNDE